MSDSHDLLNDNDMYSFSGYEVDDMCSNGDNDACREYSVYTKKKRQRRLSINSLSIIYSYMDYKRLGRNSHFEREEMQGYSDAFIDLDKVPIVINGKKL